MKQRDVHLGGRYLANVSGRWVQVEVTASHERPGRRTMYDLKRADNGRHLSKERGAAALRPLEEEKK